MGSHINFVFVWNFGLGRFFCTVPIPFFSVVRDLIDARRHRTWSLPITGPGGKPPGALAVLVYLRQLVAKAEVENTVTLHRLHSTHVAKLVGVGAEMINVPALHGA